MLRALTQQNAFVTRLPDGVSFRFHHMMKECAERLFAQLPAARQTEVWQRYGRWYAQKAQYLHALQAFEHCGDRDAALAVIERTRGICLPPSAPPSCCSGWTAARWKRCSATRWPFWC